MHNEVVQVFGLMKTNLIGPVFAQWIQTAQGKSVLELEFKTLFLQVAMHGYLVGYLELSGKDDEFFSQKNVLFRRPPDVDGPGNLRHAGILLSKEKGEGVVRHPL